MEKTRYGTKMDMCLKQKVIDVMTNPLHDGMQQKEIAQKVGVSTRTIRNYLTDEVWEEIRRRRLDVIRQQLSRIDEAIFIKAMQGDVPAAKLIYMRWNELQKMSPQEDDADQDLNSVNREIESLKQQIAYYETENDETKDNAA